MGGVDFDYFLDLRQFLHKKVVIRTCCWNPHSPFGPYISILSLKMAKIVYLLTQPKKDAENGRPCIFWSPCHAKILKSASQVFKVPKSDKKWAFYTSQGSSIIVNKIVIPTVSEIEMVRSVQTLI